MTIEIKNRTTITSVAAELAEVLESSDLRSSFSRIESSTSITRLERGDYIAVFMASRPQQGFFVGVHAVYETRKHTPITEIILTAQTQDLDAALKAVVLLTVHTHVFDQNRARDLVKQMAGIELPELGVEP